MNKLNIEYSELLDESTISTTLSNGLKVYICKKKGFAKKIGMFGTKYGSVINDFIDINTGKRIKVPDGVAHYLEHKLFEKEDANALDLFSKLGADSNAYTSYDQTVYYFSTVDKFEESIKMLVKLIKEPYFTKENVAKEQGIIGQEIKMYDDDPAYVVYFNCLKAMYQKNPVRIDIAGTIESIAQITPEVLYTCYNTFYSPQNMFFIVVGDVDVDETIKLIEDTINSYPNTSSKDEVVTFAEEEPEAISQKEITKMMSIYSPLLYIGYKMDVPKKEDLTKNEIIADFIYEMYFSKESKFYDEEYNKGVINDNIVFYYEGTATYAHTLIAGDSVEIDTLEKDILEYIERIKFEPIDEVLFERIMRKKIGQVIRTAENYTVGYRRIIDSVLRDIDVYEDIHVYEKITSQDVKDFLNNLVEERRVTSKMLPKD